MQSFSFMGSFVLGLALPAALLSFFFFLIGWKKNNPRFIQSAQKATILVFILISLAVLILISAFLAGDYSIAYVYNYSNRSLPFFFKLTGLWAGLDGSILFWTWLVSLYAFIILIQNRDKNRDWMPTMNAVMMSILIFFLSLMIFANNPFTPNATLPADGRGLNPLLQNIAMVVHPPMLYLGFTGFSVPFAFVIAALVTRRLDASWIDQSRRWTLLPWTFLTIGLILGGAWAYVELGWGGFWAWDPVENAALMPWLTATAYIHSVMTQKKRGMLLMWNVSLVILTFILTLFGTYLTRSGIVQSVHAFSDSNLGPFFLGFIGLVIATSFYLVISRRENLKSHNELLSFYSKESAFLMNNVLLLVATFAVMWGTLFPSISELFTGSRVSVGIPFFNKIMSPIGLALLLLMGAGPMISWRKSSVEAFRKNILWPLFFGFLCGCVGLALGVTQYYALGSVSLIAFVFATLWLEFYRGVKAVRLQKNLGLFSALVELILTSNRRYGGYIVHIGVLLIFIGIGGSVYKQETDFALSPGETFDFHGYTLKYKGPKMVQTEHKMELFVFVDLLKEGKLVKELRPAKYFYQTMEETQPSTEMDILQTFWGDVYLVIGTVSPQTKRADFKVTFNPFVSFIWVGGFIILLGVIVVMLPRMAFKKASKEVLKSLFLIGVLFVGATQAKAEESIVEPGHELHEHTQGKEDDDSIFLKNLSTPESQNLKTVTEKVTCKCGGCVRMSLDSCTCDFAKKERGQIIAWLREGKTPDDIVNDYIKKYGLAVLIVPPESGFFNVGYVMPSIFLAFGIILGLVIIRYWMKRKMAVSSSPARNTDPEYLAKMKKEFDDFGAL